MLVLIIFLNDSAQGCLEIGFKWSLNPFTDLGADLCLAVSSHLLAESALLETTDLRQAGERERDDPLDPRSRHGGRPPAPGTEGVDVYGSPSAGPSRLLPRHEPLVHESVEVEPEGVVGEADFL